MIETILWRILGNDVPQRHSPTQTEDCLRWILERESIFPYCTKRFLLNRIVDEEKKSRIVQLLVDHGMSFTEIPFNREEYSKLQPEDKGTYLTNQAGAKNLCIDWGLEQDFDFILPFNGQIFVRDDGWEAFVARTHEDHGTRNTEHSAFLACFVFRTEDVEVLLNVKANPTMPEVWKNPKTGFEVSGHSEPQIIFSKLSDIRYREKPYGESSVDLLYRLNIHGIWDNIDPDKYREALEHGESKFQNTTSAGFCFRLPSGNPEADKDGFARIAARHFGLQELVEVTDREVMS